MGLGWTQGGSSAPVAIPMYLLQHVQFPPYCFISVHSTEEMQYKSCFNYSKQAAAQPWWFLFSITEKEKLAEVWKGDNLFCSISECSSLFSKIYDSSPAFCLLDSAVIIFINVLKYVLRENTFRTAKLFHSFKKL